MEEKDAVNNVPLLWVPVSEIEPLVLLGGIPTPECDPPGFRHMDWEKAPHHYIANLQVRTVIAITDQPIHWNIPTSLISYHHVVMLDHPSSHILKHFWPLAKEIRRSLKKKDTVLIHCHAGISRSAAVLAAYYLFFGLPSSPGKRSSVEEVLNFIRTKRPYINPNAGFISQLEYLCSIIANDMFDELIKSEI